MTEYRDNRLTDGDANNPAALEMAITRDSTPTRTGKKRFRKENIRQAKPRATRALRCHFASTETFSDLETTALLTALHEDLQFLFPILKGDRWSLK